MAPAHIKFRKDRGTYYLIDSKAPDGKTSRSLNTDHKGFALHKLDQYIKGLYEPKLTPMIKERYEDWVKTKVGPLYRRSRPRNYRQHFTAYILPRWGNVRLLEFTTSTAKLKQFQADLLREGPTGLSKRGKGLGVASAKNVIEASFRAF